MLSTICGIKKKLGKWFDSGAFRIEYCVSNPATKCSTTRFARCNEVDLVAGKIVGHHLQLQRLPAAVDSLESDELPAH